MKLKNKKILSLLLLVCLACSIFVSGFSSHPPIQANVLAEVTSAELYITTYNELKTFATKVNSGTTYSGKTVALAANITIESSFNGIGTFNGIGSTSNKYFKGTFDGDGYTINNLNCPLFNCIDGATIQNIYIESGSVSKNVVALGAIVSYSKNSTVWRCKNTASVTNERTSGTIYTGGVVGFSNGGSIKECSNEANVKNTQNSVEKSYVGGIVGYAEGATINNCYVYNSNITALAEKETTSPTNILSGDKKTSLTVIGSWFDNALEAYKKERDKLYSENEEKNKLISKFFDYADKAQTYKKYGCYVPKWSYLFTTPAVKVPYYNFKKWKWEYKTVVPATPVYGWKLVWDSTAVDWVTTEIERGKYTLKAAGAFLDMGFKGDWKTAFKAGWQSIKQGLATKLTEGLNLVYETFKSKDANNHYSFVNSMKKSSVVNPAYAFGIGYSTKNVTSCYTADVNLSGGKYEYTYDYSICFTNEVKFVVDVATVAKAQTKNIAIKIKQSSDLTGLLSSGSKTCYYFDSEIENASLIVTATDMADAGNLLGKTSETNLEKSYKMNGNVLGGLIPSKASWFDNQKVRIKVSKKGEVSVWGAKNGDGTMCKVSQPNLTTALDSNIQDYNNATKSNKSNKLPSGLSSSIWAIDDAINNGYPHLKYRYWQDAV
ncbi:MAG: hypothetical protein E7376_01125 [Clostridiales bacterium]|nr:hypothetical protein [Clostridiales bacterium]